MVIGCLSHLSADTSEQENAIILGWCVELVSTVTLKVVYLSAYCFTL